MNLFDYFNAVRQHWWLVLGLPLLVAILSLGAGLVQSPRYQASVQVIVSRGVADENSTAGVTWAQEDTVAQDLPTIISSPAFAQDVAAELARQGSALNEAAVAGALNGTNQGKIVTITATAASADDAVALAETAVTMLQTNGLRYWGDPTWTPERPGVNIGPLDGSSGARKLPTTRELVSDAAIRAAVGLLLAVGIAAWRT